MACKNPRDWLHHRPKTLCNYINQGCSSTVYSSFHKDRVIKLNRHPDIGLEYLLWAQTKGWGGLYAPKLFAAHTYENGTYGAVLERLEKAPPDHNMVSLFTRNTRKTRMDFELKYPRLADFLSDIQFEFGYIYDIHEDNIMYRPSNNKPVLIDFSNGRCPKSTKTYSKVFP